MAEFYISQINWNKVINYAEASVQLNSGVFSRDTGQDNKPEVSF